MNRRELLTAAAGAAALGLFPAAGQTAANRTAVAYFTWYENVRRELITDRAIELEAAHSTEMDGSISKADAVSAASLAGPGMVTTVARWVASESKAPLAAVRVKDPYPVIFDECYERASDERVRKYRPPLTDETLRDMDLVRRAETVFLVFPNWDYALPVAVQSFLGQIDWKGKIIAPACLHGTGGFARTITELRAATRGARILTPLSLYRIDAARQEKEIRAWTKDALRASGR